jgi:DHA2 family multidrug resistance protein
MATGMIDAEISRQALMIAYLDNFWAMKWAALFAIPCVLLMRRSKPQSGEMAVME